MFCYLSCGVRDDIHDKLLLQQHWLGLVFLVYIITHPKQHWPFLGYRKFFLSSRSFLSGLGCHMRLHWFARVPGSLISPSELFHCAFLVSAEAVMCPAICSPRQAGQPHGAARSLPFAEHSRICCL